MASYQPVFEAPHLGRGAFSIHQRFAMHGRPILDRLSRTFLSALYGATDLFRISNDSRSSIVAKFRAGFISHSSLKIEREISHTFEIRNFPQ